MPMMLPIQFRLHLILHRLLPVVMLLVSLSYPVAAEDWESRAFLQRLAPVLEEIKLPSVTEIVPGYPEVTPVMPGVVVTDFINAKDTPDDWGKLVGQILRWDLAYAYSPALRTTDYYTFYQDAFTPDLPLSDIGRAAGSGKLVAKRLGLQYLVSGRIEIINERFNLELQLHDITANTSLDSLQFSDKLDRLPGILDAIPARIYAALKLAPPTPQSSRAALLSPTQLQQLVRLMQFTRDTPNTARTAAVNKVWQEGNHTPLSAAYELSHLEAATAQEYLTKLDAVAAAVPQDAGIRLLVARLMPASGGMLEVKKQRLIHAILERPHDPMPLLILADALADNGYGLGAVALTGRALVSWPENYRPWWSEGYALINFAWEYRGTNYWEDVPEAAKRLFPVLKDAAGRAADRALAKQRDNSGLWVFKMMTIGQYNDDFMQAYRNAIRLNPTNRQAYDMALNYTLPQWGGSRQIQNAIWAEAKTNIQDPAWLEKMQQQYRNETSTTDRMENALNRLMNLVLQPAVMLGLLVLIIVLVALVIILILRGRPAR